MDFITAIIKVFTDVFAGFVGPLAGAMVDLFSGLFVDPTKGLTELGQGLIAFAAIGMVIGAFRIVYGIFRTRVRKSM